ncbi:MAG: hypothetical protein K6E47_15430 [Lachnospiraceae bacterium]|nr:hypothetical protein [Lachnospiraceae bacterium]
MRLSADFKECRDALVALGDENRLHILSVLPYLMLMNLWKKMFMFR